MVTVINHGGSCCGMKHIRGFNNAENNNPDLINAAIATIINGQGQEVVLNGMQVQSYPHVLERLAHLGFVLDGHWRNGNHGTPTLPARPTNAHLGTHNYRFTRADRREALLAGPIAGRWNGMVIDPALTGLLTPMNGQVVNVNHFIRALPTGFRSVYDVCGGAGHPPRYRYGPGDIILVTSERSRRVGRRLTVIGMPDAYTVRCRDDEENVDVRFAVDSVAMHTAAPRNEPLLPPRPGVGDRVQYTGNRTYSGAYGQGEYATIVRTNNWPYLTVSFDRLHTPNNQVEIHSRYFHKPENPVPFIDPPANVAAAPQRHTLDLAVGGANPLGQEVAVEAVVLFRTYHNVYRDGRVGAGYDTFVDARAARRGDGRIDRKEMLSDGTSRMVENILE